MSDSRKIIYLMDRARDTLCGMWVNTAGFFLDGFAFFFLEGAGVAAKICSSEEMDQYGGGVIRVLHAAVVRPLTMRPRNFLFQAGRQEC